MSLITPFAHEQTATPKRQRKLTPTPEPAKRPGRRPGSTLLDTREQVMILREWPARLSKSGRSYWRRQLRKVGWSEAEIALLQEAANTAPGGRVVN